MKKLYMTVGAFAAVLVFSVIGASGASGAPFTLWDECSQMAPKLEFANNDCNPAEPGAAWGWKEIVANTNVDSLLVELELLSFNGGGADILSLLCLGFVDGNVGAAGKDEVLKLLNDAEVEITATKPDECEILSSGAGVCTAFAGNVALAWPVNLPWASQLVEPAGANPEGDLLSAGNGNPGWTVKCNGLFQEGTCTRAETILKVTNLEAELEVDLTFPANVLAACAGLGLANAEVIGTVSIFLEGTGRALRAM